ncbi:MAG: HAMP domain-containing histidine kinase [Chloroflexi bacterium]|nr:HAMP domain-containing histidine kinase [Chloroflexota bacterium]
MLNSLRFRLVLSYVFVALVSVAIIGLALLVFLRANGGIERLDYLRLTEVVRTIQRTNPPLPSPDPPALKQHAQQLAADHNVRVIFIDRSGAVLTDSDVLNGLASPGDIPKIPADGAAIERGVVRDSSQRAWLYVLGPGGGLRLVALTQRTGPLQFLIENFLTPLLEAACVGVALSVLMAFLITDSLTRSVRRLSAAASAVAQGNLDQSVPVSGPTELRSLAQSFNDMIARVRQSQLAQRDFVANVSHELKTPLTSIHGFSQAILDGAEREPKHAARIINDEASRMRRLVDGLLDLARLDAGQAALNRAPTDLAAVLRSSVDRLSLRANEKNVTLRADLQPLPTLVADGDRLAQVFTNLLDNAVKHTPDGGSVTLAARQESGWVTVSVTDTGVSIPPDDLSRVFERFYRVDKSRAAEHGYGIGLAITKEIVQAHGGAIKAESVTGLGTKFTVQLPAAQSGDTTVARKRTK